MKPRNPKYAGMKVNPYKDAYKNVCDKVTGRKKTRKRKANHSSITSKRGLSAYQLRTQEEFMKIRENETHAQWSMRTRFRRIRTEEEIAMTKAGQKRLERLEKLHIYKKKSRKIKPQIKTLAKDFDFLKYYVFIINWASIKYNIAQADLEIGFHFYENIHFSQDQFQNKCALISYTSRFAFHRFKKEGYIYEFKTKQGSDDGQKKATGRYRLTTKFINVLTAIYEKIAYVVPFDFTPTYTQSMPPELEKMILEMAQENQDILTGKKEPDKIILLKS